MEVPKEPNVVKTPHVHRDIVGLPDHTFPEKTIECQKAATSSSRPNHILKCLRLTVGERPLPIGGLFSVNSREYTD